MVVDFTDGIDATLIVIDTRVFALLADTCESSRAVRVDRALRLALNVWVPLVVPDAGAAGGQPLLRADGVDTARRWVTGFRYDR